MADFPLYGGAGSFSIGAVSGTSRGVVVTSSTANVKGAWSELSASTEFDAYSLLLMIQEFIVVTAGNEMLIDIGVGGAGNEEVIAENIIISHGNTNSFPGMSKCLPISIPSGTRVAARCQSSAGSQSVSILMSGLIPNFKSNNGLSLIVGLGINTTTTRGISFDPGAVADTKGAWSEVDSSLGDSYKGFLIGIGGDTNTSQTEQTGFIDVGIGGAGNEEVIAENIPYRIDAGEFYSILDGFFTVDLAEGQRLAVRAQCSITNSVDRVNDVFIYGVK